MSFTFSYKYKENQTAQKISKNMDKIYYLWLKYAFIAILQNISPNFRIANYFIMKHNQQLSVVIPKHFF